MTEKLSIFNCYFNWKDTLNAWVKWFATNLQCCVDLQELVQEPSQHPQLSCQQVKSYSLLHVISNGKILSKCLHEVGCNKFAVLCSRVKTGAKTQSTPATLLPASQKEK